MKTAYQKGLGSCGKAKMHDVAVGNDVILTFEPPFAGVARPGLAAEGDIVVVGDRLGPDESALEVGMDCARRLRRFGPPRDRPSPRLLRPDSEIGHQMQER